MQTEATEEREKQYQKGKPGRLIATDVSEWSGSCSHDKNRTEEKWVNSENKKNSPEEPTVIFKLR